MDKSDRFLIGIVVGIVGLIIIAVAVTFVVGRRQPMPVSDDTPQGVIQNYILAIQDEDYETAYRYLSPSLEQYPSLQEFRSDLERDLEWQRNSRNEIGMRVQEVKIEGDSARVYLTVSSFSVGDGVFGANEWTREEVVYLNREDGEWKITQFFHPYWRWDWTDPPELPDKEIEPVSGV